MELNNEIAIKVAEMYVEKKESLSNLHYIVVGHDKTVGQFYADEHVLCPNNRESDKIKLEDGEFLVKVYNKASKKESKVLRNDNFILP